MKYNIVTRSNEIDLEIAVNALIESGWTPLGGVALNNYTVMQVMTHPTPRPSLLKSD